MTAKELSNQQQIVLITFGDIAFQLYTDVGNNSRKYIYIKSFDENLDITWAKDRTKQFNTVEKAQEYCIKLTKEFLKNTSKAMSNK